MAHPIQDRPYQVEAREAILDEWAGGVDSTLLVLPTGTGKTTVAGMIATEGAQAGLKTLFLAHREELVNQAAATFERFGLDTSIEMAGQDALAHAAMFGMPQVVVGSVQTMQAARLQSWRPDTFGRIVVDEAHHALAQTYRNTLDWFQGSKLLGLTATPDRGDGRNLGSVFQTNCYEYPLRQAIRDGWLAPIRTVTCKVAIDLRDVKPQKGDLNVQHLEERVSPHIEELADAIIAEAGNRPVVVFMPAVASALLMAQALTAKGLAAGHVAGMGGEWGMPKEERRLRLRAFNGGNIRGLVCCDLLIEGWDCPRVAAVAICRPTLQRGRYSQMVGRGTRPDPASGKDDCLIIDFDWTTDAAAKALATSVDLFDESSFDPDVTQVARDLLHQKKGAIQDVQDVVEEAEEIVRVRRSLQVRLTGKTAKYERVITDPVGVGQILGVKLNPRWDMDVRGGGAATPAQAAMLRHLGMSGGDAMSKFGASKMIDRLKKRSDRGLAGVDQVRELLRSGVSEDLARAMTTDQASAAIRDLAALRPTQQGNLFS